MAMTGSEIAKGGYRNEQDVVDKINNWKNDLDARRWLEILMYDTAEIASLNAYKIGQRGYKSDIYVEIQMRSKKRNTVITSKENIQVKLVSGKKGFNQVEKRKVAYYKHIWHIPDDISDLLKYYDGEYKPYRLDTRDDRRMFVDEFTLEEQERLKGYLQSHIVMIVSDIIRGRGRFAAEWTLVIHKNENYRWVLISVNEAISMYLGKCQVEFTDRGNIRLGNVTLQRKGGDGGADTANMLQFKTDPLLLFTDETRAYSS